jgi:hypothetical protein
MKDSPSDVCPLGPHLQHYWDCLSDTEKRMEFDEEGLFSLALQPAAMEIRRKTPGAGLIIMRRVILISLILSRTGQYFLIWRSLSRNRLL